MCPARYCNGILSRGRTEAMRCKSCGNQNPEDHRFCGMCGKALAEAPRETPAPQPPPQLSIRTDLDAGLRKPLLLDEPVRARDVSYLLDETEEEERSHGFGRILLLVFGLALIGGFGYMYFLSGDAFSLLKPPQRAADAAPPAATAPSTASGVNTAAGAAATAPLKSPAPAPAVDAPKPSQPAPAPDSAPLTTTPPVAKPAPRPDTSTLQPTVAPTASVKPVHAKVAPAEAHPKPVVKPAPKPSADLVAQAEKLVYGDGVPQDCDRGLGAMRPLATASDPRAMIALGALYTTGTCVPRDLPTAYSWYARALHQTPDNLTLQQDMKQIWGQMTAPERQLAIRLSQ